MGGWHPFFQRTHGPEDLLGGVFAVVSSVFNIGQQSNWQCGCYGSTNGSFIPTRNEQVKLMLHETIRNEDFWRNTALQHCCEIVSDGYNIAPALQRCVALNFPVVVANRPV